MENLIDKRKEKIFNYLKEDKIWIIYLVLVLIILFGIWIRTRNIWLFQNYSYIPDVDSYLFVRYAQYIVDYGSLMVMDMMRNVPLGANTGIEAWILAYIMAYMYKFFAIFSSNINMMFVAAWYPPIFFGLGLVFFFLLVKRLFNWKIALLSSTLLTIVPAYLYRTMAGVSDKEPLAMFFVFSSLYFYTVAWQSNTLKKSIIFGTLSGLCTGLLSLAWGGVGIVTLILSLFLLIQLLLYKLDRKDFYVYLVWVIISFMFIFTNPRYGGFTGVALNYVYTIPLFIFVMFIINFLVFDLNLFKIKEKLKEKVPLGISLFVISLIFFLIFSTLLFSISAIPKQIGGAINDLFMPEGTSRFQLTVAEGQKPHFDDWISSSAFGVNFSYMGWTYFFLFFIGSILLFYNFIKPIKKYKYILTGVYITFITLFIFSQYSDSSILNGKTFLSRTMYFGSLVGFILTFAIGYIYAYYKDKELFNEILNLDKTYTFIFVWFFLMIIAARGGMRLFFVFAPITTVLAAYLIVNIIDYNLKITNNTNKIIIWGILVFLVYVTFSSFLMTTYGMAKYTGLSYDNQWQAAEKWVKQNTKEDAVFSHWWDYGYWVQTGFNRATVLDGGNYIVYWDHLFGRYVLTGTNVTRALEFLKTHKANYLLVDPSDIGKYPAYASIGSDENYDRFSQIPLLGLNPQQTQETRNQTLYVYSGGGFPLDEDLIYNENIFPKSGAGIVGVILPVSNKENEFAISQPNVALIYNGQQYSLSLGCVYVNNKEYNFENSDLKGCLRIIPTIDGSNNMNYLGAAYYLSPKVKKSIFARLYLLNEDISTFKLVYSDEPTGVPFALYNGRPIGPLKIWEISYPIEIKENLEDLKTDFPSSGLYSII